MPAEILPLHGILPVAPPQRLTKAAKLSKVSEAGRREQMGGLPLAWTVAVRSGAEGGEGVRPGLEISGEVEASGT